VLPRPLAASICFAAVALTASCGFSEDFPALSAPAAVDDDAAPTTATMRPVAWRSSVYADAEDAPLLYGQPDEDFWTTKPAPTAGSVRVQLPLADTDDPAGSLFGQPDEDFWTAKPRPVASSVRVQLPLGDPEEVPSGSLFGQPDEDFWVTRLAPIVAAIRVQLPLGDPEEIPAAALFGQPDEDFWAPFRLTSPAWAQTRTQWVDDDLPIAPVVVAVDDDGWRQTAQWGNWGFRFLPPDGDDVASAPPDDDAAQLATFQPQPWRRLAISDDGYAPAPFAVDDYAAQPTIVMRSQWRPVSILAADADDPTGYLEGQLNDTGVAIRRRRHQNGTWCEDKSSRQTSIIRIPNRRRKT
jgi:hypothetical protein